MPVGLHVDSALYTLVEFIIISRLEGSLLIIMFLRYNFNLFIVHSITIYSVL